MFQPESQAFNLVLGGSHKPKFKLIMIFMIMGIVFSVTVWHRTPTVIHWHCLGTASALSGSA